jgi:hypothetical protein
MAPSPPPTSTASSPRNRAADELGRAVRLAAIPAGVAVLLGMLLLPRAGDADSVPLPIPSAAELAREAAADLDRAAAARREPLPGPVRALGSAIRDFHRLEIQRDERVMVLARSTVDAALVDALPGGDEPLLRLRAVELEDFLVQVHAFERTGVESPELTELAGTFVQAMRNEGFCQDHTIVAGDAALVAMFKQMWNTLLGLHASKAFALSLDEQRALYALYLGHALPAPEAREALDGARRGAHDERTCEAVAEAETAAIESRRLERIAKLGAIDPQYPAAYARGVANLRRRKFSLAADAFRAWLLAHPDGPLSLRAQTFLRTSLAGEHRG